MLLPDVPPSVDQGGVKGVKGDISGAPWRQQGCLKIPLCNLFGSKGYLDFWQGLAGGGHQR